MRNKFIIASFALLLAGTTYAQSGQTAVSAESNFYSQSLDLDNRIELYPNPAVDFLIVEISNSSLNKVQFEMHSIIGNEITINAEDIGNNKYRIQVKDFATGYYFLVVKDEVTRFKKAYRFLKN